MAQRSLEHINAPLLKHLHLRPLVVDHVSLYFIQLVKLSKHTLLRHAVVVSRRQVGQAAEVSVVRVQVIGGAYHACVGTIAAYQEQRAGRSVHGHVDFLRADVHVVFRFGLQRIHIAVKWFGVFVPFAAQILTLTQIRAPLITTDQKLAEGDRRRIYNIIFYPSGLRRRASSCTSTPHSIAVNFICIALSV